MKLGIFGATGLVGQTMLKILEERESFKDVQVEVFASSRSKGQEIDYRGQKLVVQELSEESIKAGGLDYALSALDADLAAKFLPLAAQEGIVCIDNSSYFRMDLDKPLVVPEINLDTIRPEDKIIPSPNCSTIQSIIPLKPIYDAFGIKRIIYSTYQSTSGSGVGGLRDLEEGLKGEEPTTYPYPIAFNLLPHIDKFLDNGYTKEEMKMINETRKILGDDSLAITATAVRVPVKFAHAVSINVETKKPFSLDQVYKVLEDFPGLVVQDDPAKKIYPMNLYTEGKDEVFVGRIRRDESIENGLNLWCTADNIRKGAALNTIQILEKVAKLA